MLVRIIKVMRRHLLLGILLTVSLYAFAAVPEKVVEKSRSGSGVTVIFQSYQIPGPQGPTGPTGPTGPETPSIRATAYQSGAKGVAGESTIVLPFDTIEEANGITLDNNIFTLPQGTYSMHFQFTIDNISTEKPFAFSQMKLKVGCGTYIPLNWNAARNDRPHVHENSWTSFSGQMIFNVPEDETKVMVVLSRTSSSPFVFDDPTSANNFPTRIDFHRI